MLVLWRMDNRGDIGFLLGLYKSKPHKLGNGSHSNWPSYKSIESHFDGSYGLIIASKKINELGCFIKQHAVQIITKGAVAAF